MSIGAPVWVRMLPGAVAWDRRRGRHASPKPEKYIRRLSDRHSSILFFSIRNRWIEECAASLRERSIVLVGFDTMRQRPP
ncbi:hypothetical protein C7S16_6037 [Burkholderia thailandensis]|uniref:Uncharacterized protein n=1 Tax=Burkholderia thailandensis TaxID=57975 RepID=A0AAW9CMX6_BURTH|nr:hypothetical protein [Burkholderia thailandensis]